MSCETFRSGRRSLWLALSSSMKLRKILVEKTQFSHCRQYRYTLRRSFLFGDKKICFVMLNPSTATSRFDDPTTRRAVAFAQRMNCKEYLAVNLFAFRSTDPKGMRLVENPVGPKNNEYLLAASLWADEMIIAWGSGGKYKNRDEEVLALLQDRNLWCLGKTKSGHPRFPLYLRRETEFEVFK